MNSRARRSWLLLFIVYMLLLIRLVVLKGPFVVFIDHLRNWSFDIVKQGYETANFKPFTTLEYYLTLQEALVNGIENIMGNILLVIPLGALLPLAFNKMQTARKVLLWVMMISFCFETFQLLVAVGHFDVDDLFLNITGGSIGYVIYLMMPGKRIPA